MEQWYDFLNCFMGFIRHRLVPRDGCFSDRRETSPEQIDRGDRDSRRGKGGVTTGGHITAVSRYLL
jgi:hypothetical protein